MSKESLEYIDYLVVGQGLAGTLLAHFLLLGEQRIKVIDRSMPGATSIIAAGVVNPVTGRRIAKSWRFEELYHFAKTTYHDLENLLGISIWRDRNILRALHNNFEESEWLRRSAYPDYEPFMLDEPDLTGFEDRINPPFSWGELQQCAQVAMPELVRVFRQKLQQEGMLSDEDFDYQMVRWQEGRVLYKNLAARKIIFCEGAKAIHNPWFNYLPFVVTKGELLLVRIPGADFRKMLKHHIFIVPLKDDLYWVGSTSRFEFSDEYPSAEQRQWLERELRKTLTIPFEIIDHQAGIRPTVFNIRPFLGLHPEHPELAIFNGLGTKGASLGPFFAKQLVDFLLKNTAIDPEVDIRRFHEKWEEGKSQTWQ